MRSLGGALGILSLPADLMDKVTAAQTRADAAMTVANTARTTANAATTNLATINPQVTAATSAVNSLPTTLAQAQQEHVTLQAAIDAERAARIAADTALQALIDGLAARPGSTYRKKAGTGTLTLAIGNVDVPVTWDSPMPADDYACWPVLTGTGGLAAIDPPVIKSQSKTGCVVTIRSRLSLAATVTFTAYGLRVA